MLVGGRHLILFIIAQNGLEILSDVKVHFWDQSFVNYNDLAQCISTIDI